MARASPKGPMILYTAETRGKGHDRAMRRTAVRDTSFNPDQIRFFDVRSRSLLSSDGGGGGNNSRSPLGTALERVHAEKKVEKDNETEKEAAAVVVVADADVEARLHTAVLTDGARLALIDTVESTLASVCENFRSTHALMVRRERNEPYSGDGDRDVAIVAWVSKQGIPDGVCVLEVRQGDFVKSVFIRDFAMMAGGDRNPYTHRFIQTIQWLVERDAGGPLWVKEPIEQRVDLWRATGLMESDERERFRRVSRVKEEDDDEAFAYALYQFLRHQLVYPQRIAEAILGYIGMGRVTAYMQRERRKRHGEADDHRSVSPTLVAQPFVEQF